MFSLVYATRILLIPTLLIVLSGNSNSIAHLIENEIPLAHISTTEMATTIVDSRNHNGSSPNANIPRTSAGTFNETMSGQSTEDIDIVGGVLMENGGLMSNQRNGSYSNLYPDNDLSTRQQAPADPTAVLNTSVTGEGFYSNIPQIGQNQGFPSSVRSSEDVSDRMSAQQQQQHVYSNINEERDPVVGNERISWGEESSSPPLSRKIVVDDLDLDDLSTVATAFQGQERTKKSSRRVSREKLEKIGSEDSSVSSASSRPTMMTSTPNKSSTNGKTNNNKKHIIPIVAVIEPSNNGNNLVNCPVSSSKGGGGAADELNATKMQILHDTTMIDCALDLDSLDVVIDTVR